MTVALVAAFALAGACVQATTGMGFALILTPIMFALLSPVGAIVAVTLLGLELNLLVLFAEGRRPRVAWREVTPILAAVVPGTVCGVLVLRVLPKPLLQVAVGLAVIGAVLVRLRAVRAAAAAAAAPATAGPGRLAVGFATGALTTSAGVSGPPLALWLSRRGLAPADFRDSLTALFLATGIIGLVALLPVLGHAHLQPALLVVPVACVLAGHAVGSRAFARLDARAFEPLLLAVILAAGVASVVFGIGAL
ncbi:MAG TPA: sulfite exporter TauE/SafE family protein [Thermoleophilaceae bacterium]